MHFFRMSFTALLGAAHALAGPIATPVRSSIATPVRSAIATPVHSAIATAVVSPIASPVLSPIATSVTSTSEARGNSLQARRRAKLRLAKAAAKPKLSADSSGH